jgi:hypothetical protein
MSWWALFWLNLAIRREERRRRREALVGDRLLDELRRLSWR